MVRMQGPVLGLLHSQQKEADVAPTTESSQKVTQSTLDSQSFYIVSGF